MCYTGPLSGWCQLAQGRYRPDSGISTHDVDIVNDSLISPAWHPCIVWQSHRRSLRTEGLWFTKRSYGNLYDTNVTQRTHGVMITSLLRQHDVSTSLWRNNDVIITSRVRWGFLCLMSVEYARVFVGLYICTLRPRQNGRRFVDGISKFILIF